MSERPSADALGSKRVPLSPLANVSGGVPNSAKRRKQAKSELKAARTNMTIKVSEFERARARVNGDAGRADKIFRASMDERDSDEEGASEEVRGRSLAVELDVLSQ